ncbi:adenylate/guanylate cyclase domain-containing protein [Reyranella sp.]|uniref:adenylate/guanylate cyclase domain-containing protein n=1 Tax=Reyranella sp. TaxID=1929291 RepID=UPI003BABC1CA
MKRERRSIPFSVTLLTLMGLIIVPLAAALLLLGWRAVDQLEMRNVSHRMAALDNAMEGTLVSGLRLVVAVGTTLADTPEFKRDSGVDSPDAKLRQLALIVGRFPAISAAYVGYDNGDFLYAGETEFMSPQQRLDYDVPDGATFLLRTAAADGSARRETWWFELEDGSWTPPRRRTTDYDPRRRPWFIDARREKRPVLTEPYAFAFMNTIGVSAGVPMGLEGVIGFDFTIDTLTRLLDQYRITPNSIIMVASGTGKVFMESEACRIEKTACLPGEDAVRSAMRETIAQGSKGERLERVMPLGGRVYQLLVHAMPETFGESFRVAAAVPLVELTADSQALVRRATIAAAIAVTLAVIGTLLASLLLSRSISRIAVKTESIRSLDFSDRTPVDSRITEIVRLSDSIERMREGLEVFGRYVSKNLVHQIMRSPESAGVGGTRREITVMFSDIEGFSLLSESMEPELLTSRLSRYFDVLGSAILVNRGTIDKYIGDSIMAFWNAPEPDPDHVVNACRAALQASAASRALSEKWRGRGRPGFRTRFGLHTGPAVVGNVGARERINYTLVGAVANQASRLEGLNKVYGTEVLASGEVAAIAGDQFVWRHIDRIVAAGTTEEMEIYEPMGELDGNGEDAAFLDRWREASEAYRAGRFEDARSAFRAAATLRPEDAPCALFIGRCEAFLRDGTPPGWTGAWHFDKK